jgi:beta-lactamase superfamily II metal-dependent hydrolase
MDNATCYKDSSTSYRNTSTSNRESFTTLIEMQSRNIFAGDLSPVNENLLANSWENIYLPNFEE